MDKVVVHINIERGESETTIRLPNELFDTLGATHTVSVSYVDYDEHIRIWRAPLDGWVDASGEPRPELTDREEEEERDLGLFRSMPNDFDNTEWEWSEKESI